MGVTSVPYWISLQNSRILPITASKVCFKKRLYHDLIMAHIRKRGHRNVRQK